MNKILVVLLVAAFLSSCENHSLNSGQTKLNLVTPTGEQLATNVNELNSWTARIVSSKFSQYKNFEVTSIEYLKVSTGYVAKINYLVDGLSSNFYYVGTTPAYTNNPVSGRLENMSQCTKWEISCSGSSCCTPSFNLNTGAASCTCSDGGNSGCTLTANCLSAP
jgi:hypothetical protein